VNKIAIISGCGNMGLIYANSFLRYKIVTKENLLLVEKNIDRQNSLSAMNIGKVVTTDDKIISECNIVILAVKPQDFKELAQLRLKEVINPTCVVLIYYGWYRNFLYTISFKSSIYCYERCQIYQ
jgi:pyrroline-5-carboxylate reductase